HQFIAEARLDAALGQVEKSRSSLRRIVKELEDSFASVLAPPREALGEALHLLGTLEPNHTPLRAEKLFRRAAAVWEAVGLGQMLADTRVELAKRFQAQGRIDAATVALQEARRSFERTKNSHAIAQCDQLRASWAPASDARPQGWFRSIGAQLRSPDFEPNR